MIIVRIAMLFAILFGLAYAGRRALQASSKERQLADRSAAQARLLALHDAKRRGELSEAMYLQLVGDLRRDCAAKKIPLDELRLVLNERADWHYFEDKR